MRQFCWSCNKERKLRIKKIKSRGIIQKAVTFKFGSSKRLPRKAWWLIVKCIAWGQYLISRCDRLARFINFARIVATPAALNSFELKGFDQSKETVGV
jgi:hypothetical protein